MTLRVVKSEDEIDKTLGNAVDRVIASLQPDFEHHTTRICRFLADVCESPIEVMLGAALWLGINLSRPGALQIVAPYVVGPFKPGIILRPQFEWQGYRSDFAFCTRWVTALIECDGHDFHERTKEQAEHDRRKDRAAQAAGYPILRFTGSEIYRDPQFCSHQIMQFVTGAGKT